MILRNMLDHQCIIILLLITYATCYTDICNDHCENTFPLHTTDKVAEFQACLTGCRLKYVSQLTSSPFIVSTSQDCTADCSSVFLTEKEKTLACQVGCKASFPKKEEITNPFEEFDLRWHVQLVQPLFMMKHYMHEASSYVQSSYVFEQNDNGNSLMIRVQVSPDNSDADGLFQSLETKQNRDAEPPQGYVEQAYEHGSRWLNCVERRSGVPYIHVVTVLLLSLLFIAWVACSSCDEADEEDDKNIDNKKHTFGKVFSINSGDVQFDKKQKSFGKVFSVNSGDIQFTKVPLLKESNADSA